MQIQGADIAGSSDWSRPCREEYVQPWASPWSRVTLGDRQWRKTPQWIHGSGGDQQDAPSYNLILGNLEVRTSQPPMQLAGLCAKFQLRDHEQSGQAPSQACPASVLMMPHCALFFCCSVGVSKRQNGRSWILGNIQNLTWRLLREYPSGVWEEWTVNLDCIKSDVQSVCYSS